MSSHLCSFIELSLQSMVHRLSAPRNSVSTVDSVSVDEAWLAAALSAVGVSDDSAEVQRLRVMLANWAEEFAELRRDVETSRLVEPRRGLRNDEARPFLRAIERGFARVDEGGFVTLPSVRPKRPLGRYALLSKSGSGVSVNLEYVVQIGATAELVFDYNWQSGDVDFERGEFDALQVRYGFRLGVLPTRQPFCRSKISSPERGEHCGRPPDFGLAPLRTAGGSPHERHSAASVRPRNA